MTSDSDLLPNIPSEYMELSISDAARIIDIKRPWLYKKYLNTGEISTIKDSDGNPRIAFSELIRVFPDKAFIGLQSLIQEKQGDISSDTQKRQMNTPRSDRLQLDTPNVVTLMVNNARLESKIEGLERQLEEKEKRLAEKDIVIADKSKQLERITYLLEDKSSKEHQVELRTLESQFKELASRLPPSMKAEPVSKPRIGDFINRFLGRNVQ